MCEYFFRKLSPFRLVQTLVEADYPATALEAVASHLELVHCVDILHMHLDAWTIRRLRGPEIQIFVSSCFKV